MRIWSFLASLILMYIPAIARAEIIAHPECAKILPPASLPKGSKALLPEDLVRLRDIGAVEPQNSADPAFTLSQDGHRAVFQLRQGDPTSNRYCLAMAVLDLTRHSPPRIIDEGGEVILEAYDMYGIADQPLGLPRVITPRWSGDGTWVAYLKRNDGITQVWRANIDGSGSTPLTHANIDVVDFVIGRDGSSVIYATRPDIQVQERQNAREGLRGWHYDDRFVPWISKAPVPLALKQREILVLDVLSGKSRRATTDEIATVNSSERLRFAEPTQAGDTSGLDISAVDVFGRTKRGALRARLANGSTASCDWTSCEGAQHPWWMPGHEHVRFFRKEGWGDASIAIYDWDLKSGSLRRLYLTDELLGSCAPQGTNLICLAYASLVPGHLVRLDPASGKRQLLFDLNPEFAHLALGKTIRLHWRNAFGVEAVGDLVYPVKYRPGHRYPMVVVQYDSRGFLRGGTDDEYPIQAFANRGYAVLSFKRPQIFAQSRGAKTFDEIGKMDLTDFADRRSVESSLEGGVRLAIERGVADPERIGITGLSDGATTVQWALIHSSLFSAAAVSSLYYDPSLAAFAGSKLASHFLREGWPNVLEFKDPLWKQATLFANARRIRTPILVSSSDYEMLGAVMPYAALREAGVPIDMFVFPGEFHARWQPAHKLANDTRSIDWFDYWLRGIRSIDPERQAELKEWDHLKSEGNHGHPI